MIKSLQSLIFVFLDLLKMNDGIRVWGDKRACSGVKNTKIFARAESFLKGEDDQRSIKPIYELSSSVLARNMLRSKFKSGDFNLVAIYRNQRDAYTKLPLSSLSDPQIDHVVEIQCLSYVIAKAIYQDQSVVQAVTTAFKPSINIIENFNITAANLNSSKMNVFKTFLREKISHGIPLFSFMNGTLCEPYMSGIKNTFSRSYFHVKQKMENVFLDSKFITHKGHLSTVCDEFEQFYDLLKINE